MGDVDAILESSSVGVVMRNSDDASRAHALASIVAMASDPQIAERCVAVARARFSLEAGVRQYDAFYRALTADSR